jgi:glyoxylase I family protein
MEQIPEGATIAGLSHVSISVSDLDASLAFYRDVLGLPVFVDTFEGFAFEGREVMFRTGSLVFNLQEHAGRTRGDSFDATRVGLDHLAFAVRSLKDLEAWADRLDAVGVVRSEIKDIGFGHMIELRDPDGIQLELFSRRPEPQP